MCRKYPGKVSEKSRKSPGEVPKSPRKVPEKSTLRAPYGRIRQTAENTRKIYGHLQSACAKLSEEELVVVGRLEAPAEALGPRRRAERRVLRVARVRVRRPRQSSEEDPPHEEAG